MMLRPRCENAAAERETNLAICLLIAFLAGMASGFFGMGGGFLIVPGLMLATRMPMIKAVGSSLLAVSSFGLATAIDYSLSDLVNWRIAVSSSPAASLAGMMLANRLSHGKDTLKRVFAVLIFVVAGSLSKWTNDDELGCRPRNGAKLPFMETRRPCIMLAGCVALSTTYWPILCTCPDQPSLRKIQRIIPLRQAEAETASAY